VPTIMGSVNAFADQSKKCSSIGQEPCALDTILIQKRFLNSPLYPLSWKERGYRGEFSKQKKCLTCKSNLSTDEY